MIADFWQDLRFGARMLIIKPGFTLAAALAPALGIGANTAIFSVIMTVLARPLPFGEPDTLVYLWNTNPALGARQNTLLGVMPPEFDFPPPHTEVWFSYGLAPPRT